jgi:hypothetical protein
VNHELPLLDQIDVASPCTASWDEMSGTDQVRFCSHCRLNVYNLSEMPREQAENLVRSREGRLCVRFYRRHDGTVLTRDCPVGIRALKQRLVRGVAALAGLVVAMISGTLLGNIFTRHKPAGYQSPAQVMSHWADPWSRIDVLTGDTAVMGGCPPPVQQQPPIQAEPGSESEPDAIPSR